MGKRYWVGEPSKECDVCKAAIKVEFFDAATRHGWGILCRECFAIHGYGLGTGKGQHYIRQDDGKWLKNESVEQPAKESIRLDERKIKFP